MKRIFFVSIGLIACNFQDYPYSSLLTKARESNKIIPDVKWNIEQFYTTEVEDYFALSYECNDTSYYLRLFKSNLPDSMISKKTYFLFEKKFSRRDSVYKVVMDLDTLCYFKYPIDNIIKKYFYVGKYYYLYSDPIEMDNFSICQHNFYQNHMDSLIKVKGNDLPELPCDSTDLE